MTHSHDNGLRTFLNEDGSLIFARWAKRLEPDIYNPELSEVLDVDLHPKDVLMHGSAATGIGLVSNGFLGVDLIRCAPGEGFVPHTHPGDHLLIVVGGTGTITYGGKIYETHAGEVYMVEGEVPHAVGAISEGHAILAVGAPHKPVDAKDRMTPVEYQAVASDVGDLHCLICDVRTVFPSLPHESGCPHCPCGECQATE